MVHNGSNKINYRLELYCSKNSQKIMPSVYVFYKNENKKKTIFFINNNYFPVGFFLH